MKLFTRTDNATVKATLALYKTELNKDKRRFITFCTLLPIGAVMHTVIIPLLLSFIIQSLITHPHDLEVIWWMIGGIIVASSITVAFNDVGYRKLFVHEESMTSRLMIQAVSRLLDRGHQFFANHKVGSLSGDVYSFSRSYMMITDALALQGLGIIVNFVASLIVIAFLSPILLLPLVILTVAIILMSYRSLMIRAPIRNVRKRVTSQLNGTIADILGNNLLVRTFARAQFENQTVQTERTTIEDLAEREINLIQREANWRWMVLFAFQILTVVIGIWLFTRGALGIAALIFVVTYLGRVTGSLFGITGIIRTIEQAFLDASPITRILSEPVEITDVAGAKDLNIVSGKIECRDVTFRYSENKDESVFSDMNLTIPAGQRVGLAGHSGGGKTTFTQLLLRFADIEKGTILIDGQDISEVTQASLHTSVSYVPQDPFLFHRSLRENIAYGRPDASDKEIEEAAQKAHAMEFIDKLPEGLDTVVGERGVKLSGGQRQRIAIARAILKDAPILVLDEATSALDSESEKFIQASLNELMKGRTSIVIAHRLSTIAKLDRILVLSEGKITEDGTHAELLKRNGTYAKLWSHQSGGFIEE